MLAPLRSLVLLLAALTLLLDAGQAGAQGRLEAKYTASLAGIPVGKGNWTIEITDSHYSAAASGGTTGLLRVFAGGEGTSAAGGTISAGKPAVSAYSFTVTSRKKTDSIRFSVDEGTVTNVKVDPPQDQDKERVPVTEAHLHGVQDPMTAMLLRAPGTGSSLNPDVCKRTLTLFDGKLRYDLQLAFKRMDTVKADKGYAGPVLVCAVYFTPVAGYIPSRSAIRYLARMRDVEVWLAPIAGTRVLVPFRMQGPTPIGLAALNADQFITVAAPATQIAKEAAPKPKAPANAGKTQ